MKKSFQGGLIVIGDIPQVKNTEIFQSGEKYKGFFSKWSYCNGLAQVITIFQKGLVVMGDLSKWKNTKIFQKWSHYNG